MKFTNTIKI